MLDALDSPPLKKMKLDALSPEDIKKDSSKVLKWLEERNPSNVIIHLDLDVLDMKEFRSILPAKADWFLEYKDKFPKGSSVETIIRVLQDVGKQYKVVGVGITEHIPWDALYLQNMLSRLPLIGDFKKNDRPKYNNPFE